LKIIHPFSIPDNPIKWLEPIPAAIGREAGYTLDRSPVHHRATQKQTTMHAHTHSLGQFGIPKVDCMFLDGRKNLEYPSWDSDQEPS